MARIRRYEELTLNSSSALKQMLYDGWVLRFSPGSQVKRANSVSALYPSSLPLNNKLDYCEAAYARQGLPARFRLHEFCDPELDLCLAARGYEKIEPTLFMTLALEDAAPPASDLEIVELALPDWLEINHALRGTGKETVHAHRARLESISLPCFPVVLVVEGLPVCVGLGVAQDDHFGLFDIFTPGVLRNRGYGKLLTCAMLAIAQGCQAQFAYLQVDENNGLARRLYEGLGFAPAYCYWYRVKS